MSAAVIQHPGAVATPVANPRWRGRYPAHVVLLRRVREAVERQRCEVEAQLLQQRVRAIAIQVNNLWHLETSALRTELIAEHGRLCGLLRELGHDA